MTWEQQLRESLLRRLISIKRKIINRVLEDLIAAGQIAHLVFPRRLQEMPALERQLLLRNRVFGCLKDMTERSTTKGHQERHFREAERRLFR